MKRFSFLILFALILIPACNVCSGQIFVASGLNKNSCCKVQLVEIKDGTATENGQQIIIGASASPTASPSVSVSPDPSPTPSASPSPSATVTSSPSPSPTPSPNASSTGQTGI